MEQKNEIIYIRITPEMKKNFKKYCQARSLSMTDALTDHISKLLLDSDSLGNSTQLSLIKKERDFLKSQLRKYSDAYTNISNKVNSFNREDRYDIDKFYSALIIESFNKIKQFENYEIYNSDSCIDIGPTYLTAVNKSTNEVLLIEIKQNISRGSLINASQIKKKYQKIMDAYKEYNKVKFIFLTIEQLDEQSTKFINFFSKEITQDVEVYWIEYLIDLDNF